MMLSFNYIKFMLLQKELMLRLLLVFELKKMGKTTVGQAADTDTLVASANAYLNALNKMIIKREKTAPKEMAQEKVKGI